MLLGEGLAEGGLERVHPLEHEVECAQDPAHLEEDVEADRGLAVLELAQGVARDAGPVGYLFSGQPLEATEREEVLTQRACGALGFAGKRSRRHYVLRGLMVNQVLIVPLNVVSTVIFRLAPVGSRPAPLVDCRALHPGRKSRWGSRQREPERCRQNLG